MKSSHLILGAVVCAVSFASLGAERLSPFDDAAYVLHGGVDANGNGVLDSGSSEFRDISRTAETTSAHHVCKYASTASGYGKVLAQTGRVVKPMAGTTFENAPYLHIEQSFVTNGFAEVNGVTYPYGQLYSNHLNLPNFFDGFPANTDCTNYTCFIRFRDESKVSEKEYEHQLAALGFVWNNGSGVGTGLAISIAASGGDWFPKLYLGQAQYNVNGSANTFKPGHWCDLAVSVAGAQVTVYTSVNVSESPLTNKQFAAYTINDTTKHLPVIKPNRHWARLGGEECGITPVYTNGYMTAKEGTHDDTRFSNKVKAFRGDVQTFAFWTRALSASEVRQVFSERRPALVKAGLANGSSNEFTGETDTFDQGGTAPETWNPVLDADHPVKTVTFAIANGEQGVSQYLRIRPVAGSAPAAVTVALDGAPVARRDLDGAGDALVYLKPALMTQGDHTLTLTRTDSSGGAFAIDALSLAGSWRLGTAGDEYGGMEHETQYPYQYKSPRNFYLEDGNMSHFARGLSGDSSNDNATHIFTFDIPADILPEMRETTFTLRTGNGVKWNNTVVFTLNGEALATLNVNTYKDTTVKIPASRLKAGANTLSLHLTTGGWLNCSGYLFSLGRPAAGSAVILR